MGSIELYTYLEFEEISFLILTPRGPALHMERKFFRVTVLALKFKRKEKRVLDGAHGRHDGRRMVFPFYDSDTYFFVVIKRGKNFFLFLHRPSPFNLT